MDSSPTINPILKARIAAQKNSNPAPTAQILKLPQSLAVLKQAQDLNGDIVRIDKNGTIHIRTSKGNIEVKIDNPQVKIENGAKVTITLDAGSPPQNAIILLNLSNNQTQITKNNASEINLNNLNMPPKLNAQEIINSKLIKTELITQQNSAIITQPYIEEIDYILNPLPNNNVSINSQSTDITGESINTSTLPLGNTNDNLHLSALAKLTEENTAQILTTGLVKLNSPTTKIPLSIIMAHLISNPDESPITLNKTATENKVFSVISEIKISDIKSQQIDKNDFFSINSPDADINTQARSWQTIAELAGFTHDKNFPVIKIIQPNSQNQQYYVLQIPIENLDIGAQITIEVSKTSSNNIKNSTLEINNPALAFMNINPQSFLTPEIWATMQELQSALTQANPQIAHAFSNIVPNISNPANLAPSALFFIAALRSGDVQNWLSEKTIETLKRAGKSDIIKKINTEFSHIMRANSEQATQEWRALSLPLAWQNEIHKAVIHYRKEDNNQTNDSENSGSKTRFVMDLNLSNIGKIQLDGLFVDSNKAGKRLDLILRSEDNFSESMKMEMRAKFKDALNDIKFTGDLNFQSNKNSWVNISLTPKSEFSKKI